MGSSFICLEKRLIARSAILIALVGVLSVVAAAGPPKWRQL